MNTEDKDFICVSQQSLSVPFGKYILISDEIADKLKEMLTPEQRKQVEAFFVAVVDPHRINLRTQNIDEQIAASFPPEKLDDEWICQDTFDDDTNMPFSIHADFRVFFPDLGGNSAIEFWLLEQNPDLKKYEYDCEYSCFYVYFKTKEDAQEFIRLVNEIIVKEKVDHE